MYERQVSGSGQEHSNDRYVGENSGQASIRIGSVICRERRGLD
jgi:hypothetical protein